MNKVYYQICSTQNILFVPQNVFDLSLQFAAGVEPVELSRYERYERSIAVYEADIVLPREDEPLEDLHLFFSCPKFFNSPDFGFELEIVGNEIRPCLGCRGRGEEDISIPNYRRFIAQLASLGKFELVYNEKGEDVAARLPAPLTFGQVLEVVAALFGETPDQARRRLVRPELY